MSEFSRILTNLGIAYGLGSKEQFIDAVTKYAKEKELNDDAIKELIEQVFDEIELTNRRRKAKQIFEVVEMEQKAGNDNNNDPAEDNPSNSDKKLDEMVSEVRALRRSLESLIDKLDEKL